MDTIEDTNHTTQQQLSYDKKEMDTIIPTTTSTNNNNNNSNSNDNNDNINNGIKIGSSKKVLKNTKNLNLISIIPIPKEQKQKQNQQQETETTENENEISCEVLTEEETKLMTNEHEEEEVEVEVEEEDEQPQYSSSINQEEKEAKMDKDMDKNTDSDNIYKYTLKKVNNKNIPMKSVQNYYYSTYYSGKNKCDDQTHSLFKIVKTKNVPMFVHVSHPILNDIYRNPAIKKDIYLDDGLADADEEDKITTNHLPLELFDDPDFEIYTPKQWLQLKKIYMRNFDINQDPEVKESILKLKNFNSVFHLKLQNLNTNKSEEYNRILTRILNNERDEVDEEFLGFDDEVVKFLKDLRQKEKEYFDKKREFYKSKEFVELDPDEVTPEIKELRLVAKYLIDAKNNCPLCAHSKDCVGTKAFSRYFYYHKYKPEVSWDWERCWVTDYDEATQLYTIHWAKTHVNKKVKRLNLLFEIENKEYFYKRIDTANFNRENFEKDKEYYNMIDTRTDSSQFGSLPQFLINGIIRRVNIPIRQSQMEYMKHLINIINEDYLFSMKKNDYEFYNGKYELKKEQASKKNLMFAKNVMDTIGMPLNDKTKYIYKSIAETSIELSQLLFGANVKIQKIIIDIFGKLHNKIISIMNNNSKFQYPMTFQNFEKKVISLLKSEQTELSNGWPNAIATYIETDLEDIFNFNMVDEKEYLNSRCKNFLELISLIMEEELKKFIISGIDRITGFFEKILFSPGSNTFSLDNINDSTIRKMFIVNIHISDHELDDKQLYSIDKNNKIILVPSYDYMEEFFQTLINSPLNVAKNTVPHIETIILFGIYNANNRKQHKWVKLKNFNENDYIKKNALMLNFILKKVKGPMENLVKHYEEYEFLIQEESEDLINNKNIENIDEIGKIIEKYYQASIDINTTEFDTYEILPFIVNCASLRVLLFNRTRIILNNFNKKICQKLKTTCKTLAKKYEERYSHLLLNPGQDANQWVILRDTIKECTNDCQWYNKDLNYVKKLWNILYQYKMNIDNEISDLYWITIAWPKKILEELDVSTNILISSKNDIINSIDNNREYIESSIAAYLFEIQEYNKLDKYYEYDMLQKMITFRERINNIKVNIKLISEQEKKLGLEVTDFSDFDKLYYFFDGHETLWGFCDNFKNTIQKWNESYFCEINADEVINTTNKWNKTINKVFSIFEGYPNPLKVIKNYQEQLKDYCRFLPIIISLRNPSLQQKHWDKISQTIGLSQTDINSLHLKDIFMMNFELVQDILIEISQNATNELKLQKKLETFKQKLSSKNFVINKSFKPYIVIENFHYLSQVFEDYLIKGERLGALLSNDSENLIENLTQWNKRILQCLNFLNQWEYLQTNYLKLYAFFQKFSGDFNNDVSIMNEYGHISKLMSLISDILDKNIKCMLILGRSDIYDMIISSISRIEKILALLGNFVNDIREQFPRFYFLSNKSILKIIINSSNIQSINFYINLYFQNISKLNVEVKRITEEGNEEEIKNDNNLLTVNRNGFRSRTSASSNHSMITEIRVNSNASSENGEEKESNILTTNNKLEEEGKDNSGNNKLLNMASFSFDSFHQDMDKSEISECSLLPENNNNIDVKSLVIESESIDSNINNLKSVNSELSDTQTSLNEIPKDSYVTGIYSNENEYVKLKNYVKVEGRLYEWMKLFNDEIINSMREYLFEVIKNKDYEEDIDKWINYAPSQIVILAIQIIYTRLIDSALETSSRNYMKQIGHVSSRCNSDILKLTNLLNKNDKSLYQQHTIEMIIECLNYYRDIINVLKSSENNNFLSNYDWIEKNRYYIEGNNVYVKVFNYKVSYEFNFVGTYPRLILTNQQNNFRSTLITSLNFSNFNTYVSPVETGKTESLISFAKSLGRELIIVNCNTYITPINLMRIFKGYLITGFWVLFENLQKCSSEFLSVLLQYVNILKREIDYNSISNKNTIQFFDQEYDLKPNHGIFINISFSEKINWSPLHSSLKKIFRCNSIQSPEPVKIFESILLSYGFRNAAIISKKVVLFMHLFASYFNDNRKYICSIKTIKREFYAKLKKINSNRIQDENAIVARILNHMLLPQINLKEMVLFRSLFKETFNFTEKFNEENLTKQIEESCNALGYTPIKILTPKIEQLYNLVDSGKIIIMLGSSLSGKTTSLKVLEHLMRKKYEEENKEVRAHNIEIIKRIKSKLGIGDKEAENKSLIEFNSNSNNNSNNINENIDSIYYIDNNSDISDDDEDDMIYGTNYENIDEPLLKETELKIHNIYPNACKPEEIYGYYNPDTRSYTKGIVENILESVNENESDVYYSLNKLNPIKKTWICIDSNGSAFWTDSLFTQIENKKSSQSITMNEIDISKSVTFLCETSDINIFTPSIFSYSVIVNYSVSQKLTDNIVIRWVNKLDDIFKAQMGLFKILYHLFMRTSINFATKNCDVIFDMHPSIYIDKVFELLEALIEEMTVKSFHRLTDEEQKCWIITTVLFCVIWVIGGMDKDEMRIRFDEFVKTELLKQEVLLKLQKFSSLSNFCLKNMIIFPREGTVYDYYFDNKLLRWKKWETKELDTFLFPSIDIGYDNIIRTKEALRVLYLNRLLLRNNRIPLLLGKSGIGKSISAWASLNYKRKEIAENSETYAIHLNANSTLDAFRNFITQNLYKKRLNAYGLSKNKKYLLLVDDLDNIECNNIQHSSIIELLREWFESNGWYIKGNFYHIEDVMPLFTATTSLSFRRINPRLLKNFHCIAMDDNIELSFNSIISSILDNHFRNIKSFKSAFNISLTTAMKNIYQEFKKKFPQTVSNPHYIIQLKDIVDIIHGVIEYSKQDIEQLNILKIWNYHCYRVIQSKLMNHEDQKEFFNMMKSVTESVFDVKYEDICVDEEPYYYFQYSISKDKEQKTVILQVDNINKFFKIFMNKLLIDRFNPFSYRNSKNLFKWLYPHALKFAILISRYLEMSNGHILLMGNNEFDHSKLVRLAASLNNNGFIMYEESELGEETFDNWREFLKDVILKTLTLGRPTFVYFPEFSIKHKYQIHDIDSLMTIGFIYDLYGNSIPLMVVTNLVNQLSKEGYNESIIIDHLPASLILFIKRNIHIVISTNIHNPLKELDQFHTLSSALYKCAPIWYSTINQNTQLYVSSGILGSLKDELGSNIDKIQDLSIAIFNSINKTLAVYNKQYNKDYALSNKSYISFVEYFVKFYRLKNDDIEEKLGMYNKLIERIDCIYKYGQEIKNEYYQWVKKYEQYSIKIQLFLKEIENENERLSKVSQQIKKENDTLSLIKKQITKLQDELEEDCKKPANLIDEALEQIENLTEDSLKDLNFVTKPSENEKIVIQTLCIVLNIEPNENESLWSAGKRNICEKELLDKIRNYELDNITQTVIHYIDIMIDSKKFDLDDLLENSIAVGAYASWILAIRSYCHLFHIILPKKKKITIWEQKLEMKNKQVNELREYETNQNEKLKEERLKYDQLVKEKEKIMDKLKKKESNYKSSLKVIDSMTYIEQNIRNKVLKLRENKEMLIGDCSCASFIMTYTGRFTRNIKNKIIKPIFTILNNQYVTFSSNHFSITKFMKGDRWVDIPAYTEIPECLSFMDNLLQVKMNDNWCLISDRHLIFYKYYSMFDKKETVDICSVDDEELSRKLIQAIEKGHTFILLLYEKGTEDLPLFVRKLITQKYFNNENYKSKQIFSFSGIADNVLIAPDFRLHLLITKPLDIVEPTYLRFLEPILIDTPEELTTNILLDCYFDRFEPVFNINRKKNTKNISDTYYIINKNIESTYEIINILEKKDLYTGTNYEKIYKKNTEYNELNKNYDDEIATKEEFNKKVKWINNLCKHASWLFQLISKFNDIYPLYQFNLNNYLELITENFKECPMDDEDKFQKARSDLTQVVYDNVSLILHPHDRIVFSFIISLTNVFYNKMDDYSISEKLWNYFLNKNDYKFYQINESVQVERASKVIVRPNSIYSDGTDLDLIAAKYESVKKSIPWITEEKWNLILNLSKLDQFSKVPFDILKSLNVLNNNSRTDMVTWDNILNFDTSIVKIPPKIENSLKSFEKILLTYYIRPYSLYQSIEKYIESVMGESFTDINQSILETALNASNHHRPIIVFVDSDENGVDYYIKSFSRKKGMANKLRFIMFNNNTKEINGYIEEAMSLGHWVILTNTENQFNWYKEFEGKLTMFKCHSKCKIKKSFRLWIIYNKNEQHCKLDFSNLPPYNYIQNCVKIMEKLTNDFRFQFNEAISIVDDIFTPTSIGSLNTYQMTLFKICLYFTIISLSVESGSIILSNNLLFNMKDLRLAGLQVHEIFSYFLKNSGNIKIVHKLIKGIVLNRNLKTQSTHGVDTDILINYFNDIMNLTVKTQVTNTKNSHLIGKLNPYISNIMNQDLQATFDALQSHEIDKVHSLILSMNRRKNQATYFGLGNFLKKEKSKRESNNIMASLKKLYIEDINAPRLFLWNTYDKVRGVLQYFLQKFQKELKGTIFNLEKYSLDDIEKNIKITRFLDYVLLDSVKHYYQLLVTVTEYFKKALDPASILNQNYKSQTEEIMSNTLPYLFKVKNLGYPTQLNLNAWINDFIERMIFIQSWYEREAYQNPLIVYDLSKIYNPGLFIIGKFFLNKKFLLYLRFN